MKRVVIFLLALLLAAPSFPQAKKPAAKGSTTTQKKTTTTNNKNSNNSISGLRNQRANVQKKIKEQEGLLQKNKADVKKRLGNLMTLNGEIDQHQKSMDSIQNEIAQIDKNIELLNHQLSTLEGQLDERKTKYIESMRYMARNRNVQDKLMFIFSAKNFAQMYRRLRFVREYAAYQRVQGEMVKEKQGQIEEKHKELQQIKAHKNTLLSKNQQEQAALQNKEQEQKMMVLTLQKQQKTILSIIDEQKKKDAALNAQIDKLVAEEIARAKARAEAEAAKKKAEAEAEAKRRAEELARKQAEAEAAAKENERKIAEAKEKEERLKAEAKAAEQKSKEEKERADRAAKEAEANRIATERKAKVEQTRRDNEIATAKKVATETASLDTEDRKLSGSFERNRGRLPMPITGSYRIVSHFGQYNVEGLKNVQLDNKGINILGSNGASARAIFDGEVSAVFSFGGTMVVMVRHGQYISVYCNLRSVNVHRGQKVSTSEALGAVGTDNILQFQLRKGTEKLNPEAWLRK
ncbi:MAG: peptidoglycan DD-metalloendopeptidase family protein [Prevotella sp.]|nr:peptidoglycan DD-metalloendopeptidase family protein [Prevotella sp.]